MFTPPTIHTDKQCSHHQPYTQTNNVYTTNHVDKKCLHHEPYTQTKNVHTTNHTHRQTMFITPTIHINKQCYTTNHHGHVSVYVSVDIISSISNLTKVEIDGIKNRSSNKITRSMNSQIEV